MAACDGYVNLTVERILATAEVSRTTFYQYFSSVDDCFLTAYRHQADQLVIDVTAASRGSRRRELAVLDALVAMASSRPDSARVLMREGLAAGPAGLSERDALIGRLVRATMDSSRADCTVDLPIAILIGGTFRFLSMCLTDGRALDAVGEDVRQWVDAFAQGPGRASWSATLAPNPRTQLPQRSNPSTEMQRAGGCRERILRATAATVRTKSYRDVSVADIVSAAGVSRRSFYNEFQSKADAFVASYEHGFQEVLAACTPAFFSAKAWPERVWHSARAFAAFLAREPLIAYLGLVECYAIGPGFAPRIHDTQLAFTIFLDEGYRHSPKAQSLSRACSALTATAVIELGFQASRRESGTALMRMHPLAVYIALAPFIGRERAGEFVMAKLSRRARHAD